MSEPRTRQRHWSDIAIHQLGDSTSCPVCEVDALFDRHCRNCGADLTDDLATEIWTASEAAAAALQTRQAILDTVPRPARTPAAVAAQTAKAPTAQPAQASGTAGEPGDSAAPQSSATVQSVLAVAGAGIFAIAAIVFAFFNPELTDRALRSVTVGFITILFLAAAWRLARRRLQFSAEAVGALGMVFIALDVHALSELAPTGVNPWAFAAIGTLVSGVVMAAAAAAAGIRSWLWISLVGLAFVPAMLGYAGGTVLASVLGHLGAAFAALALIDASRAVERRFGGGIRAERVTLTVLQLLATAVVIAQVWLIDASTAAGYWLTIAAVFAAIAVLAALATRHHARPVWSLLAGATGVTTIVLLPFALDLVALGAGEWYVAVTPAAGGLGLVLLGAIAPTPRSIDRTYYLNGALGMATVSALATLFLSLATGAATALGPLAGSGRSVESLFGAEVVLATVLGVLALSIGFWSFAAIIGRRNTERPPVAQFARVTSVWLAALAALTFVCLPAFLPGTQVAIALVLAIAGCAMLVFVPRIRAAMLGLRLPVIVGVHFAVLLGAIISWADYRILVSAGIAVVAATMVLTLVVPREIRFLHFGASYAYGLVVFATALDLLGVGTIALLCLTTSLGSLGAIAATFIRRLEAPTWYAILVVTSVPFLIGVVQVIFERSGWTALSTGLIFLLALTLLVTRRTGLGVMLRAIAAGILVPSLAVVVVCLGAQVLLSSASPVTLPMIAAIVAIALPSTVLIRSALERRGIGARDAAVVRIAIEVSALVTGAIAVVLALVRVAAGLPTTFIVLVILGLGSAASAYWTRRRYGWWVAGASFTGALWCLWALAGIGVLEPYLLPPSVAAATIGLILTARGFRAVPLYTTGLIVAVAPVLVLLTVSGSGAGALAPWRGYGLVAATCLLLGLGLLLGRSASTRSERLRALRVPTLWLALMTGAAGAVQGVRFGLGADQVATGGIPLVLTCFGIGLAGAVPAAMAARAIRLSSAGESRAASTRWLYAPAAAYLAVATWTAIERDWFTIWAMWSLMLAYLVIVVVIAWKLRTRATGLPPVWFTFALAFVTGIVAWSLRDLRVEWFSLPMGIFLLVAGAVVLQAARSRPGELRGSGGTFNSWPARWNGSWALLAPGLVTTLLASVIATFTDPLTWRAILVITIALVAILVGSSLKLAAPFIIGIVLLPLENALVFLVQIGRGIESMPWWITLAVVGAVLLIIAVTYERRAGEANSITARLRDLS